ncbi:AAA family ATPase [Streptomyces sp900129855]|uniref:AAA family ATPase n=1 Tax=Streptomyces sp. 900129855 TaxID=3155129 RepID=A0ABV2ZXD1_9ACTN
MPVAEPLLEREAGLATVAAEATRACSGSGRLVLLKGATGTGRSALLEAAARHAAAQGMQVLRVRCSTEPLAPLTAVCQLLSDRPELAYPVLDTADAGSADPAAHRERATRLWRALLTWTEEAPLFMAIDDVHLADSTSRGWLVEAARLVERLPVLLVATERSQYDVGLPAPGLDRALSPGVVRTHTLAPLRASASARLVRAAVGSAVPDAWVDDMVRAGAGSPLFLRALLDDLRGQGPTAAGLPESCAALYSGAFPAAVSWWLECAGAGSAEVARALAVVNGPDGGHEDGDGGLLAAMTDSDPSRVRGWLTAMTHLGLLRPDAEGRPRYAHPLLRDAVLSGWSGDLRGASHGRAAEAMLRNGASTEAVAGQLLSAPAPVGAWAADVLLDAAARAVGEGRTADAVTLLRRALGEALPPARQATVLTQLGSLEFAAFPAAAGIPRLTEATRLSDEPRNRARSAIALGTALAGRGEARAALTALASAEEKLAAEPGLAAAVRSVSMLVSDRDQALRREMYGRLRAEAGRAPESADPVGRALATQYESTAGLLSAKTALARVRDLLREPVDPLAECILVAAAAVVALWADELDEAERLVRRGLAEQRASLLHPVHSTLLNIQAEIFAARGDYPGLLAELDSRRAAGAGAPGRPGHTEVLAVVALAETGCLEEAVALADRCDPRDASDSWERPVLHFARGRLRAACDDPVGALEDFLECGRRQSARDVVSPIVTPWRTAAAECLLTLGRTDEAVALAQEEMGFAEVWNTPRRLGRCLRVLGTATGGRYGLELTDRAVRLLRDTPAETDLIQALIAQGRQLAATGERTRARDPLREAADRAGRIGAVRLRALAENALRECGARRRTTPPGGQAALTDSERRIAELAAAGRTNAEIGELLHLARRTVETHLTNAYRKLGIRRRTELPRALDRLLVDAGMGVGLRAVR